VLVCESTYFHDLELVGRRIHWDTVRQAARFPDRPPRMAVKIGGLRLLSRRDGRPDRQRRFPRNHDAVKRMFDSAGAVTGALEITVTDIRHHAL
jgi:hypothetical protein